jgi:hypothetical protein
MGSLSERDRHRLAQLLQEPLIPPRVPAKPQPIPAKRVESKPAPALLREKTSTPPIVNRHSAAHVRQWVAGVAIFGLCLALAGVVAKLKSRPEPTPIRLQVLDQAGQLRIQWDPNSDLVRRAPSAKLFITDGAERLFVTLDSARLRRGAVSYTRHSARVDLRLALTQPDGRSVEEAATFAGTAPQPAEQPRFASVQPQPVAPPAQPSAPPAASTARAASASKPAVAAAAHRARAKPLEQSGTRLPFTCSPGDVFRKTDAPNGWNTFTCRSKNVWSLAPAQSGEARSDSKHNPSATKLTAKPARPSTM